MHLLVATPTTQGTRPSDFCHVPEREPVGFVFACDDDAIDGSCGCQRAMGGLLTGGATTTMEVIDDPDMTRAGLLQLLRARDERNGWAAILTADELADHLDSELTELLQIAEACPVGTVLEKRGPVMQTRSQVPTGGTQ